MRSLTLATTTAALSLLAAVPAGARQTPRTVVERAVGAHGGAERLARARAEKVRLQGKIFLPGKDALVSFTAESTLQLPARFKYAARLNVANDQTNSLVQIIDGDRAAVMVDGQPQQLSPPALAELRKTLHLQRVVRLVPLLTEAGFELTPLGESKVNNRVVFGVKVSAKGQKDLRLYFDRETGLLIKTEHNIQDGSKEVLQEEFYGDFKDFGGIRRWTRIAAFRDGKKLLEAEVLDVRYFDKIDDAEFAKP